MGDFEIKETIYHTANWPDHTYERIYHASYAGERPISLGDFENESETGIVYQPIVIENRLMVFTSGHIFIWQPEEEPIHFNPFIAEGWYEYSQKKQLNGHYDMLAQNVLTDGEQWFIQYECTQCQAENLRKILFVSSDDGESFNICLNPSADFSACDDE